MELINAGLKNIPGVTTEVMVLPVANHMPSLEISWYMASVKVNGKGIGERLRKGSPSIEVIDWEKENSIRVSVTILKPGQDKVVGQRIREELVKPSV